MPYPSSYKLTNDDHVVKRMDPNGALQYGRRNIRANCICPGCVDTPLFGLLSQFSARSRESIAAQHALGRLLRPEEIANVALFLASDESSALTGSAIVADGGLSAGLGITGL